MIKLPAWINNNLNWAQKITTPETKCLWIQSSGLLFKKKLETKQLTNNWLKDKKPGIKQLMSISLTLIESWENKMLPKQRKNKMKSKLKKLMLSNLLMKLQKLNLKLLMPKLLPEKQRKKLVLPCHHQSQNQRLHLLQLHQLQRLSQSQLLRKKLRLKSRLKTSSLKASKQKQNKPKLKQRPQLKKWKN